jgi:hypothetical protein
MALFDQGSPTNLEEALTQQADTQGMSIDQQYAKKRRQAAAMAGAGGRLGSNVQNYTTADINSSELGDLGGVQSDLASALGQIPLENWLSSREDQRKLELAQLIGEESQTGGGWAGGLTGALGGGSSGALSGFQATGSPWGALAGGVLGAGLGAYGGSQKRRG